MMNLVIEELEEMLQNCEDEGFGEREFAQQLRKAIAILKEN